MFSQRSATLIKTSQYLEKNVYIYYIWLLIWLKLNAMFFYIWITIFTTFVVML